MSESVLLNVTGMKCGGCEANVKGKLQELAGVLSVAASSKQNTVEIQYNANETSLDEIKQAICEAGFQVEP